MGVLRAKNKIYQDLDAATGEERKRVGALALLRIVTASPWHFWRMVGTRGRMPYNGEGERWTPQKEG